MSTASRIPPSVEVTDVIADEEVRLRLRNVDISMANAIRRVMISEVPTLAVELVEMEGNTSCLVDEMIAHRLGLVPLPSIRARQMKYSRVRIKLFFFRFCFCSDILKCIHIHTYIVRRSIKKIIGM
jgi:DNA-directed RNA polymerase alpha subunit